MRIPAAGGRHLLVFAACGAVLALHLVIVVATPPPAQAQTPTPMVTVYGASGSFRGLLGPTNSNTGHLVSPASTLGWKAAPGASSIFGALTPQGRVVIGTVPQSDNQISTSTVTMSLQVFDPTSPSGPTYQSVIVPTSTGQTTVTNSSGIGGADISDVCTIDTPWGPRVAGVSTVPWRSSWPTEGGHYPSLALFAELPSVQSASGVVYDVSHSRDTTSLAESHPELGPLAYPSIPIGEGPETYERNSGMGTCARLPATGHLAVGNYFSTVGTSSGSVVVLDSTGAVAGFHQIADEVIQEPLDVTRGDGSTVTLMPGTPITLAPREVRADPHGGTPTDQRFIVLYDAFALDPEPLDPRRNNLQIPFPFQEFRFNAEAQTVEPTTSLLVTDVDGAAATADALTRATTTVYAPDGTFFVARAPGTGPTAMQATAMAVFRPGTLETQDKSPSPVGQRIRAGGLINAGGSAYPWGSIQVTRAIAFDAATNSVLMSSIDAQIRSFRWNGFAPSGPYPVSVDCPVDLGRDLLAPTLPGYGLNIRNGPLDPTGRRWYLPYQSIQPRQAAQVTEVLDSYLFSLDVDQLTQSSFGSCPTPTSPPAMTGALVQGATPVASSVSARKAGGGYPDRPRGVASGPNGSTYVTGNYYGGATFGTGASAVTLSGGGIQGFLARYDGFGNLLWAVRLASSGTVDPLGGVAVDAAGNAYVAGRFDYAPTFGSGDQSQIREARGADDAFIARFSPSGVLEWVRTMGGESNPDEAQAIAIDPTGGVVVSGMFYGEATFEGSAATRTGVNDVFLAHYDETGTATWVTGLGATHTENAEGLAVDANGRTYMTGSFQYTATLDGGMTLTGQASSITGYLAAFDPGGVPAWARTFGGAGTDDQARGYDVAVLTDGSLAVSGAMRGTVSFDAGAPAVTAQLNYDGYVARFTPEGGFLHVVPWRGTGDEVAWGVAAQPSGHVTATGQFRTAVTIMGATSQTFWGRSTGIVTTLTPSGGITWTALQTPTGSGAVSALDAATGPCGALRVGSRFSGQASLSSTVSSITTGGNDVLLAFYGRPNHASFVPPGC